METSSSLGKYSIYEYFWWKQNNWRNDDITLWRRLTYLIDDNNWGFHKPRFKTSKILQHVYTWVIDKCYHIFVTIY